jgi:FADH2 O2-dependent halogenase
MRAERAPDADVIVIGGGPAGSMIGSLVAMGGHRALIIEKDVHPRDHVGEGLIPATNIPLHRIGFLDKLNDAGFIPKPGSGWNGPRSRPWSFVEVPLFEFPMEGNPQPWTFHVERDVMDSMLLRHAHDLGAKVLQGVTVDQVLFDGGRAVGVRARVADGWERDLNARVVVDASGRRCLLATQLKMKTKDRSFNQYVIYSWFRGVRRPPERIAGYSLFYFLGLNQAWAWQFPLRDGKYSVGVVADKEDFQKSGRGEEEFFDSLAARSRNLRYAMEEAERIRPFWIEGDYSYKIDRYSGPGWVLVGDALRFVDPIFSSGVDVALFSATYAYEAIMESWRTGDEETTFLRYQDIINTGVDVWYDTIGMFYKLQNLLSRFVMHRRWRESVVRTLQGNPYDPENGRRTRALIDAMQLAYERVLAQPDNLLRPWAMDPERDRTLTCPSCLGVADYWADAGAFVCRRCGHHAPASHLRSISTGEPVGGPTGSSGRRR